MSDEYGTEVKFVLIFNLRVVAFTIAGYCQSQMIQVMNIIVELQNLTGHLRPELAFFLNQVRAWFLKIDIMRTSICACVYAPPGY